MNFDMAHLPVCGSAVMHIANGRASVIVILFLPLTVDWVGVSGDLRSA